MKNFLKKAALGLMALVAMPATAEQIAVVTHGQQGDTFWDVVYRGVQDAAAATGADVSYASPATYDMAEMAALIDAAVDRQVKGLIVSLPDADALGPSVERAVEAGIPVISINSGSDEAFLLGVKLHVGQNEFFAGRAAGQKMTELGGTRAICINQEVGNIALDLRCAGFAQGFAGQVDMLSSTIDAQQTIAVVRSALAQNAAIDTIMALGADAVAVPAIAAVEAEGRTGEITVGTFDLSPNVLRAILDGNIAFAIDQKQYEQGFVPVGLLHDYLTSGRLPSNDIQTGPNLVDASTAADFLAN